LFAGLLALTTRASEPDLLRPDNLKTLGVAKADTKFMFVTSSQPGNVFYPGDSVDLTVKVTRGDEALTKVTLEVIEIAMRQNKYLSGQSVMTPPPAVENLGLRGTQDVAVTIEDKAGATAQVEVKGLKVPDRYGTYVVSIAPNGKDPQFLCTLLRAMKPKEGFAVEAPVFGEGQFLTHDDQKPELVQRRAQTMQRLGIKGVRIELGWAEGKPGQYDWNRFDVLMNALADAKVKALVTMGGHPYWTMPFGCPTPACIPEKPDHSCAPKHYEAFGKWIEEFCRRYWKDGEGSLWAIEHWNEPWEGISISGWESDSNHYRALMRKIAEGARKVDKRIRTAAACSIMNTEDKFLVGEDRDEMAKLVDVFTDHYVPPRTSYGPMVAKFWGKESTDTETWIAATEVLLPQVVCQFLACGQDRVTPWHPEMTYFPVPGAAMKHQMPNPVALASNVFNVFITGKPFKRLLFLEHLPWAYQFGEDADAVVVLHGRLMPLWSGPADLSAYKELLWWQMLLQEGGQITIDNADGALEFCDIAGNPECQGQAQATFTMDYLTHYVRAPKGGAKLIAERLKAAKITGIRPVEIMLRDFTGPVDAPGAAVTVTLHNLLNRELTGTLAVTPPAGITLKSTTAPVKLAAGASADVALEIAKAEPAPTNAYLFACEFTSEAGKADWKETLHVCAAKKGSKKIDGNLDDWSGDLGVLVHAKLQKVDPTQQAWLPFVQARDQQPNDSMAEVKLAWDKEYLYAAATVNDPSPSAGHVRLETWDEEQYFRSAKDDAVCESLRPFEKLVRADMNNKSVAEKMKKDPQWPEFEKFLKENAEAAEAVKSNAARVYFEAKARNPQATFADASYVYKSVPWHDLPWSGDTLQLAFDPLPGYAFNMKLDTDRVPYGYHAMPDTDYEYAVYGCTGGGSELWRILAPEVPRGHHYPRQARAKHDQGVVKDGQHVVKRDGKTLVYEVAIPWKELKKWKPKVGETFGFTFRVNNNQGPALQFGSEKSATKSNGLSLHPYWESKSSCGVRWALRE
jgi:hypothetical protein